MEIELPDECKAQALANAAGFASVEDYLVRLLEREAERAAIQKGLDDMKAGHGRPFAEFDADLRRKYGFAPPQ